MSNLNFVKIGDIFKVASGGTPSRDKPEYYVNGKIPWVKTGDLKGKYANYPTEHITNEALERSSAKIFPKKTVLLAMYGATIGACSILPFDAATNQACGALLPTEKYDSDFLFYYLKYIKEDLIKKGVGGAQPNISAGIIKETLIPLLELDHQRKIANILDAADALRQNDKALIAKYDELTQALFLDMFGDPMLNSHKYQKSQIGDVINIIGGSQPAKKFFKSEATEGYVRLVQIRDYKSDKYLTFVPKTSTKKFCSKDDIMIGRYGPPVFQILRGIEGAYNVALMKATPKKELINEYVFYLLSCNYIQDIIIANSQRTAGQTGVNLKLLNSIEIIVPPLNLQNQFAERVAVIEEQKAIAQMSLDKSESLFNSLLQKAFKGELV
jgi:type I restriction enzyme S subunit